MKRRRNVLDRVAEQVMDLDSPAYGDERERAVFMESSSFGLTTGLYLGVVGAVVASVFGLVLLPVALLVMTIIPSAAAHWYAKRRGVNMQELAEHAGSRSTMVGILVFGTAMVLTFAAMSYTVFTGQPILTAPSLEVIPGEGFLGGMAQGAVAGGMLGGLAAIVGGILSFRRANRRSKASGW
ncbi:hypothetical protein [Arthrobacter sp. VKM Ac-2550]|uniref:hypothetical protein n=1 Tax=Crystallibacter permensis TaxID=1938888 RepID=UPI0022280A93|nr:hypothetical protein [Arthrobacter sp. VKM Ac-2550]MCW2131596.1 hypothetical protein [Arthrobacter sp. VKM Ac-2550]